MRYLIPLIAMILGGGILVVRIFSPNAAQPSSGAASSASSGAVDPSLRYLQSVPSGVPLDRDFDHDLASVRPADLLSLRTGSGSDGTWLIQPDATAPSRPNVFAKISTDNSQESFPIAVETKSKYQDLDIGIQIKVVDGRTDKSGGIIFRFQDASNYYLFRVNAIDNQIGIYRVVDGHLTLLTSDKLDAPPSGWHALRVILKGANIQAYFDSLKHIDASDNAISKAGLIGFWTHADSVAHFDDLVVRPAN